MERQLRIEDIKCDNPELGRRLIDIAMLEFERKFKRKPIYELSFDPVDEIYFFTIINLPNYDDILTLNIDYDELIDRAIEQGEISFNEYATSQVIVSFSSLIP